MDEFVGQVVLSYEMKSGGALMKRDQAKRIWFQNSMYFNRAKNHSIHFKGGINDRKTREQVRLSKNCIQAHYLGTGRTRFVVNIPKTVGEEVGQTSGLTDSSAQIPSVELTPSGFIWVHLSSSSHTNNNADHTNVTATILQGCCFVFFNIPVKPSLNMLQMYWTWWSYDPS